MKRDTKNSALKLIEKFDAQLHEILMSDLKPIHNARVRLIRHITHNIPQDRLMTA